MRAMTKQKIPTYSMKLRLYPSAERCPRYRKKGQEQGESIGREETAQKRGRYPARQTRNRRCVQQRTDTAQ